MDAYNNHDAIILLYTNCRYTWCTKIIRLKLRRSRRRGEKRIHIRQKYTQTARRVGFQCPRAIFSGFVSSGVACRRGGAGERQSFFSFTAATLHRFHTTQYCRKLPKFRNDPGDICFWYNVFVYKAQIRFGRSCCSCPNDTLALLQTSPRTVTL